LKFESLNNRQLNPIKHGTILFKVRLAPHLTLRQQNPRAKRVLTTAPTFTGGGLDLREQCGKPTDRMVSCSGDGDDGQRKVFHGSMFGVDRGKTRQDVRRAGERSAHELESNPVLGGLP
jgi:hypothetical protein